MLVPVNNRFGILLAEKRSREKRTISLLEVSKETGVSRPSLTAWANNTVTRFDVPVIEALCQYFGVSLSELLQYDPPDPLTKQKTARK